MLATRPPYRNLGLAGDHLSAPNARGRPFHREEIWLGREFLLQAEESPRCSELRRTSPSECARRLRGVTGAFLALSQPAHYPRQGNQKIHVADGDVFLGTAHRFETDPRTALVVPSVAHGNRSLRSVGSSTNERQKAHDDRTTHARTNRRPGERPGI